VRIFPSSHCSLLTSVFIILNSFYRFCRPCRILCLVFVTKSPDFMWTQRVFILLRCDFGWNECDFYLDGPELSISLQILSGSNHFRCDSFQFPSCSFLILSDSDQSRSSCFEIKTKMQVIITNTLVFKTAILLRFPRFFEK